MYRQGRDVKHNVYEQLGPLPTKQDRCVAHFHEDADAEKFVNAVNWDEGGGDAQDE